MAARTDEPSAPPTPGALAWLFLRLGLTAFGGPAAHIALMEEEAVRRRRWLSRERFLDLLAATNLLPGPNSTEMAIHLGLLAGWRGFLLAGVCFILPAALLTGLLAWAYLRFGSLPAATGLLYGIKPVVIAVVLQALWRLGRSALKSRALGVIAVAAAAANALGAGELPVLLAGGLLATLSRTASRSESAPAGSAACLALPITAGGGVAAVAQTVPFGLWPLFLVFLKIGSVLFGSGYVLLAFVRAELVEKRGWLTEGQVLDAVAAGQVTPGPVFSTATFVGYLLGGPAGAAVATLGIFLPAFVFVALSGPLVARVRRSPGAGAFLDGVIAASLALMAVVAWELGRAALVDAPTIAIAVAAGVALAGTRLNPVWILLAGGLVGWLLSAIRAD